MYVAAGYWAEGYVQENVTPQILYGDDAGSVFDRIRDAQLEALSAEIAQLEKAAPAARKKKAKALQKTVPVYVDVEGARVIRKALERIAQGAGWYATHIETIQDAIEQQQRRQAKRRRDEAAILMLM